MIDPFGSLQGMMGQFQGFMSNPVQFMIQKKLNIPQHYLHDPNQAIQYLMNTGAINQNQYDWAVRQAQNLQNNPQFMQMFKH